MSILALVAGASAGGVADDPAAEVLAPCPIPSSARTALRLLVTGGAVATCLALALSIGRAGPGLPPDWVDRVPELSAAAAIALAAGLLVLRRGEPLGAYAGISAGLVAPLTMAGLAFQWPAVLPGLSAGPAHSRWWFLAAASGAVAVIAGRDPARVLRRARTGSVHR